MAFVGVQPLARSSWGSARSFTGSGASARPGSVVAKPTGGDYRSRLTDERDWIQQRIEEANALQRLSAPSDWWVEQLCWFCKRQLSLQNGCPQQCWDTWQAQRRSKRAELLELRAVGCCTLRRRFEV